MSGPTESQSRVLVALHRMSRTLTELSNDAAAQQAATGKRPERSWYEYFHHYAIDREALTEAAHAAAIPKTWTDHVRGRGVRGLAWVPGKRLPAPEPIDWDRVLGDLDTDIRRLQELAGLAADYQVHPSAGSARLSTAVDIHLRIMRARTTGIANVLGLTSDQGHEIWGADQDWIHVAASHVADLTVIDRDARARELVRVDTTTYTTQNNTLHGAGISLTRTPALPDLDTLIPAITAALAPARRATTVTDLDIRTSSTAIEIATDLHTSRGEVLDVTGEPDRWESGSEQASGPTGPAGNGAER
ncbi:hypothetical protein [Nocardia sp. NPDC057227]|uniref:hypothetical protein n=1 Tax=Nocardia sp. NPDC057227 TaxID=3346056 RepID=UPI003636D942